MANRKITVLNPGGYQEIFQAGDVLIVDGEVNLQDNSLTGVPTPGANADATNKEYVDDANHAQDLLIQNLDTRVETLENNTSTPSNATVSFSGTQGVVIEGDTSFTLDQVGDAGVIIKGPDLSGFVPEADLPNYLTNYLQKPGTDGTFVIVENSGNISYSETVDGGTYS